MAYYSIHKKNYPEGEYGLYLRKSRADMEAEAHGEGETLLRHEHILLKLAQSLNVHISHSHVYREVVSGETIAARPEMQRMLLDVENGILAGVFVMEIERLARGDTSDQGTVAKAFKQFDTLIITPNKTYNPANDADEEYFEFGLFMSRREFKTINRRIQSGRMAAASEGRYIASTAPFGYERIKIKNDKGYTLKIIPEQGEVIQTIFEWYTRGLLNSNGSYVKIGATRIAERLNDMGIKPLKNDIWTKSTITDILRNPVYAGKIRWGYRKEKKYVQDNQLKKHRNNSSKFTLVEGLHDAIISDAIFDNAQNLMASRSHAPVPGSETLKNPFTGMIYCGKCGRMMTRLAKSSKTPYDVLKCPNTKCDNISSPMYLVEEVVIESLNQWINEFKAEWSKEKLDQPYAKAISLKINTINQVKKDMSKLSGQQDKIYTLLEQGVYSTDIFMQRNKKITSDLKEFEEALTRYENELDILNRQAMYNDEYIPKVEYLLNNYDDLEDASAKNEALKDILVKIEYIKSEPNKKGNRDNKNFSIELFPRVIKF